MKEVSNAGKTIEKELAAGCNVQPYEIFASGSVVGSGSHTHILPAQKPVGKLATVKAGGAHINP